MTPLEFIHFDGDSSPNQPVRDIFKAMALPLVIRGPSGEFEVLSYYYNSKDKRMVLDIQPK